MTTRTAVLAGCIGLVIGAIAVVAAKWPRLPERTLPTPPAYVAMGGQAATVARAGCLAPIVGEMRKRPNHVIRVVPGLIGPGFGGGGGGGSKGGGGGDRKGGAGAPAGVR